MDAVTRWRVEQLEREALALVGRWPTSMIGVSFADLMTRDEVLGFADLCGDEGVERVLNT